MTSEKVPFGVPFFVPLIQGLKIKVQKRKSQLDDE